MAKIDMFGTVAVIGSVTAAVLFGGIFFAAARGSPLLDIAGITVVFLIIAGILYFFFLTGGGRRSEDAVRMTAGGSAGLIVYSAVYVGMKYGSLGIAETAAAAVLMILGLCGFGLLLGIRGRLRRV